MYFHTSVDDYKYCKMEKATLREEIRTTTDYKTKGQNWKHGDIPHKRYHEETQEKLREDLAKSTIYKCWMFFIVIALVFSILVAGLVLMILYVFS